MGYYVKSLPTKKSLPRWKLQFVSYRSEHTKDSNANKPKKEWDIRPERWSALGFRRGMSIEEARGRQKQLNAQLTLKRLEEKRWEIECRQRLFDTKAEASFPEFFKSEFEQRYLSSRRHGYTANSKVFCCWRAAQRVVIHVNREPCYWYDESRDFYDYFHEHGYSTSYIRSVLRIINLWGFFMSRKLGRPFLAIPNPRGYEKSRLLEAYYRKIGNRVRKSEPITPEQLEERKGTLRKEHYNWLYLSVWLGLRPKEIDLLLDKGQVKLHVHKDGTRVIWVYQPKLVSLPPWDRWKLIPIVYPEQKRVFAILRSKRFCRPTPQTIKRHFGNWVTLYGGRKGFTDLMLDRGQALEHISQWMGHSSIERTWRSYKNRRRVQYQLAS